MANIKKNISAGGNEYSAIRACVRVNIDTKHPDPSYWNGMCSQAFQSLFQPIINVHLLCGMKLKMFWKLRYKHLGVWQTQRHKATKRREWPDRTPLFPSLFSQSFSQQTDTRTAFFIEKRAFCIQMYDQCSGSICCSLFNLFQFLDVLL